MANEVEYSKKSYRYGIMTLKYTENKVNGNMSNNIQVKGG